MSNRKIAVILPVRANSERVSNKMLRPFAGSSLYEICVEKLCSAAVFYDNTQVDFLVAAYEKEFFPAAEKNGLKTLLRTKESANSEIDPDAYNFLEDIDHDWICLMSACLPMLKMDTIVEFIDNLCMKSGYKHDFPGMVAVTELPRFIWDGFGGNLNIGRGNSKTMNKVFPCANAMYAFKREIYLNPPYRYWPLKEPMLFPIGDIEAFDIDTMEQFRAAEAIYEKMGPKIVR